MKIIRVSAYVFMISGILLVTVGAMFKIQHWPDIFVGLISGPLAVLTGAILFIISLTVKRNKSTL